MTHSQRIASYTYSIHTPTTNSKAHSQLFHEIASADIVDLMYSGAEHLLIATKQ